MSTHAYKEHPIGPWRMLWGWSVQSFNSLRIPPLVSSPAPWDGFSALWPLALQGSPSLPCAATSRELRLTSSGDLVGLVGGSPHSAVILCACGELAVVREGGVRHNPHGVSDGVRLQLFLFWGGRQLVRCSSYHPTSTLSGTQRVQMEKETSRGPSTPRLSCYMLGWRVLKVL